MGAITLHKKDDGNYYAKFHFLNVEENSPLYFYFREKLFDMWNDLCNYTNGATGLINQVNNWAKEKGLTGDDPEYIAHCNSEYEELLIELCDREEYKFPFVTMKDCPKNYLKMHCVMDPKTAGEFDVELIVC